MNTPNVRLDMTSSLVYRDRVENAIAFTLPTPPDTDLFLLEELVAQGKIKADEIAKLPENSVKKIISDEETRNIQKKNSKLLLSLYEQLFSTSRPSDFPENHPHFAKRGKGNNTVTAMDQWSFFKPYTTTALSPGSRDKALHLCIVLGVGPTKTKELLSLLGERYLYDASLFDNCIWYILEANGSIFNLYSLYEKALDIAGQATESIEYEYDLESRSRLLTEIFWEARDSILNSDENGATLTEARFLTYIQSIGYYFRTHQRGILDEYNNLSASVATPDLFNFYSAALDDKYSSFLEQHRLLREVDVHTRFPTRETMTLFKLYHHFFCSKNNRQASYMTLNGILSSCNFPALSAQFSFDSFILELLRYPCDDKYDQQQAISRLIPLYQFAYDCKCLPKPYTLSSNDKHDTLLEVIYVFDALLHISNNTSFVTSCALFGRASQSVLDEIGEGQQFTPNREFMIFLILLEKLSATRTLPTVDSLNSKLAAMHFIPLGQSTITKNKQFDSWIKGLISQPPEDALLRLYPFYCFIDSFKQISPKKPFDNSKPFSSFFDMVRKIRAEEHVSLTKKNREDTTANIFYLLETLLGEQSHPHKLLACTSVIQTISTYLEVRWNLSLVEGAVLSISAQKKYPPRELPKSNKKPIWVNKFHNLHYGTYEINFSWSKDGIQKNISFGVNLSFEQPSQTILLSLSEDGTQASMFKVEAEMTTVVTTDQESGKEKKERKKIENFTLLETIDF